MNEICTAVLSFYKIIFFSSFFLDVDPRKFSIFCSSKKKTKKHKTYIQNWIKFPYRLRCGASQNHHLLLYSIRNMYTNIHEQITLKKAQDTNIRKKSSQIHPKLFFLRTIQSRFSHFSWRHRSRGTIIAAVYCIIVLFVSFVSSFFHVFSNFTRFASRWI